MRFGPMGTRVMNEYSFSDGRYTSVDRQGEVADVRSAVVSFDAPKRNVSQNDQIQKAVGLSIGFCSIFAEQLLSHPCIVLRRQCQVHHNGFWYHLTPFTLAQILLNLQRAQGGWTLWKGIGGVFVVRAVNMVSETVISEVTGFPKDVSRHMPLRKYGEHVLLKVLGYIVTTPFYAASLIETVQSDIASEKPGVLDTLREGVSRLAGWGTPHSGRLIPVWQLVGPTVALRLSHYFISSIANYTVTSTVRSEQQERRDLPGDTQQLTAYEQYFPELLATFTGNFLADFVLYPLETVVYRLYIQGTRTIIDNLDTGLGVIPISTRYEGFVDCFRCILAEEGIPGFYRGFGALILQYMMHAILLRAAKYLFERLSQEFGSTPTRHPRPASLPSPPSPGLYTRLPSSVYEKDAARPL
ncbi:LOW QUALITY PROTEIN: solute carrier family 25 member 46-like [Pomacea canaliculata]|uniref:LOW QUALITY PROTEIN: solute carrier family 25 member 46-like n=1 Tax=Pomacea canaliculata TaxID=400727 RepID=UPI000D7310BD|nr:LOW QUALITY PROTEIN: solute carrier family 25 member 46-like [Pomacea canaliculata]